MTQPPTAPTSRRERTIDMQQLEDYMLTRASEFQKRNMWESSFECLYLITTLNRGYYWDTEGSKQLLHEPSTPDADARQRIVDVVKELEAQIIDAKKNKNHERVAGYEKAIALLNDGVGRKC